MACVSKVIEKVPSLPIVAGDESTPLIVALTVWPFGMLVPAAIFPLRLMLAVPYGIVCEAVRLLKTGVALSTLNVLLVPVSLPPVLVAVMVLLLPA